MKTAYYGSRISDSISRTPEGFLICRDVPIARVGVQDYLGREIGQEEQPEEVFKVNRPAKEVFDRAAVASFEGKPVTDNHPDEDVTAENYSKYIKGVVRDVRKGSGQFDGCLVADLVIHDGALVRAIQDGKREISCGYNCLWVPTGDHTLEQREIRGNHVAVVDKGRAGHGVAIHDNAMERRKKHMAKGNILQRMWAAFAKDADPEEALEAAKLVNGEGKDEKPVEPEDPNEARFKRIEDAIAGLAAKLDKPPVEDEDPAKIEEKPVDDADGDEEGDALDALEEELSGQEQVGDEDPVEADPEDINKSQSAVTDGLIEAEDPAGNEEDGGAVRDAAIESIRALRPVVAAIPNKAQRRRAADALAQLIRGNVRDSGYDTIQNAAKHGARDAKVVDDAELGRSIAKKYNPHYMNKED
ncbi:MAG: DUF2213 domain-containing protein [Clostridia bacterium]|nr:DUF2213 domain-containing protein [Clostridia bacterium]